MIEIDVECPCDDITIPNQPEQTGEETSESNTKHTSVQPVSELEQLALCCRQLAQLMASINQQTLFRNGQIPSGQHEQYSQWLNIMRESVIQRDRYYPDYQRDWGSGGGSGGVTETDTGTTTDGLVEVRTLTGAYSCFSVRNTGVRSLTLRTIATSAYGNVNQVDFNWMAGTTASYSTIRDTSNFLNSPVYPITTVKIQIRSTLVGFPTTYLIISNTMG